MEYPAKSMLRPVEQQPLIAYRMEKALTLTNSAMIERLRWTAVSSSELTGLSAPTPTSLAT